MSDFSISFTGWNLVKAGALLSQLVDFCETSKLAGLDPRWLAGLLQYGARILTQCCNTNLAVLVLLMGGAERAAARIAADGRREGTGWRFRGRERDGELGAVGWPAGMG